MYLESLGSLPRGSVIVPSSTRLASCRPADRDVVRYEAKCRDPRRSNPLCLPRVDAPVGRSAWQTDPRLALARSSRMPSTPRRGPGTRRASPRSRFQARIRDRRFRIAQASRGSPRSLCNALSACSSNRLGSRLAQRRGGSSDRGRCWLDGVEPRRQLRRFPLREALLRRPPRRALDEFNASASSASATRLPPRWRSPSAKARWLPRRAGSRHEPLSRTQIPPAPLTLPSFGAPDASSCRWHFE